MKKIIYILNGLVFIATTLAIMGLVYQGIERKWFDIVGILIIIAESLFGLSNIVNLIVCRKIKEIRAFSIVSLILIVAALTTKAMGIEHPAIAGVIWFFYIWFYYGIMLSKKWEQNK